MNDLLVMKFGGTSMGSAERMQVAAGIVAQQAAARPVVVVVSAMSKVTDLLLESLRRAELGDKELVDADVRALLERHIEACDELFGFSSQAQHIPEVQHLPEAEHPRNAELLRDAERFRDPQHFHDIASQAVQTLVAEFQRIAQGVLMLGERPPRSVDEAIAIGERLSSVLLAYYLESKGVAARSINGAEVIVTDAVFGNASPIMELTAKRSCEKLAPLLDQKIVPVVTGFNGATASGQPTTLGRGGSDFSASILAAALGAAELWIWTDVDGIMSADPRLVEDVAVIPEVTYAEAAELAYNGAKVLHPRTLAPLVEKKIPVWSKNSFHLAAPGTRIVSTLDGPKGVRAVTSMSNVALISMEPANSVLSGTRLMARALDALALGNVEVLVFTSSSYTQSFCFLVRKTEVPAALEAVESNLQLELAHGYLKPIGVDENVGLLAVVGEGMRGTPGLAGRVFTAISLEGVNIIAIAQGSSELTIGIIVRREGLEKAVRAVHQACGLGIRSTLLPRQ